MSEDGAPTFEERLEAVRYARREALAEFRCGNIMPVGGAPRIHCCQGPPRCHGPTPGTLGCSDCYVFLATDPRPTDQIVRDMEGWMRT